MSMMTLLIPEHGQWRFVVVDKCISFTKFRSETIQTLNSLVINQPG